LSAIKLKLEYEHQQPELAARVNALQSTSPQMAKRVHCIPTLVHDLAGNDPTGRLTAIQSALASRGWQSIRPWSIALDDLGGRLPRIAEART